MSLTPSDNDFITDPEPHSPPAGDWKDDDGQALDDYFKAMAQGPQLYQAVQALVEQIKPKPNNRIIRYRANFDLSGALTYPVSSQLALPADPNRDSLTFLASDNGLNKSIMWHSESFTAAGDPNGSPESQAVTIRSSIGSLVVPNYTGPVWVAPGALSGGVCIWWIMAVTS